MPIMELPFLYAAELVAPRKRNGDRVTVSARIPVDIPEVASDEAPVAVALIDATGKPATPGYGFQEWDVTRFRDGRHYTRIVRWDGSGLDARLFADDVLSPRRRPSLLRRLDPWEWNWARYPGGDRERRGSWNDLTPLDARTVEDALANSVREGKGARRLKADDRQVRQAAAAASLPRDLLVVDGEMWASADVAEPRWCVIEGKDDVRVLASVVGARVDGRHEFRADRLDDAMAWARSLAGGSRPVTRADGGMDVRLPSSLLLEGPWSAAVQVHLAMRSASEAIHALAMVDPDAAAAARALSSLPGDVILSDAYAADALAVGRRVEAALDRIDAPCPAALATANRRWRECEAASWPDIAALVEPGAVEFDHAIQSFTP